MRVASFPCRDSRGGALVLLAALGASRASGRMFALQCLTVHQVTHRARYLGPPLVACPSHCHMRQESIPAQILFLALCGHRGSL